MMYRHTARFQMLLREALRLQSLDPIRVRGEEPRPYTDENMLRALGLSKGRTTLTKFRNAKFPAFDDPDYEHAYADKLPEGLRDANLAARLWEHLSINGYIRKAIPGGRNRINKKTLFSQRQIANTISAFFDTHETQIERFSQAGLVAKDETGNYGIGQWLCFKKSWYEPNSIVKSRFEFANEAGEYFSVSDYQRISGRFNTIEQEMIETSTGIAISKSEKLWCFLRESERDQPRIFCFFRPITARAETEGNQSIERLSVLYGHVMESERRHKNQFYGKFAVLISADLDKREWHKEFGAHRKYNMDDQLDVFPLLYPIKDSHPQKLFKIPQFVLKYLETGTPEP